MATSLTSLTQLPCEDICWKILELSLLTQVAWYLQSLIDSSQWFSSRLIEEVPLKGFWGHSPHLYLSAYQLWELPYLERECTSGVSQQSNYSSTHHSTDFFVVLFFMNSDYWTFTLDIQNNSTSQYHRGILHFCFCFFDNCYNNIK